MKNFLILFLVAVVFMLYGVSQCHAVVVCEADGKGRVCCWDTEKEGVYRPLSCM